jgi:hypothetical protein
VLKISHGGLEGRIWIHEGEIIDAHTEALTGVEAFRRILSWKDGSFEMLPHDPGRKRTIFSSYHGLLLETAQVLDEAQGRSAAASGSSDAAKAASPNSLLAELSRFQGVEFVLEVPAEGKPPEAWGLESPEIMARWARETVLGFRALGEKLQAGMLNRIDARGAMQNVSMASRGDTDLCVGFYRSLPPETIAETMHKIVNKWAS